MESSGGSHVDISCLFPEILAMIFGYMGVQDKGRVAQVCTKWRDAAYNRTVWRGVEATLHLRRSNPSLFLSLAKRGIKRVQVLSLRRSLRDVVTGLPKLNSLNLSGCYNLTDVGLGHAFVQEIPTITVLNLSLCKQITDNTLGRIAQYLRNLQVLELGGCTNITNNGLLLISFGLRKLKTLNVRSCRHISDQGIRHLAGNGQIAGCGALEIEHLGLQDCQKLTDQALKYVSEGLQHVKSINLSFCASISDTGLKYLSKVPYLKDINLRSCDNISDIGLGYISDGGSRINALDVSFCEKIGDQGLTYISQGLVNLQNLSLCACNISDDGINKIVKALHDMRTLNIGQCGKVTDVALGLISDHCRNLRSIDLYGCTKITTVGLEKIMKLPLLCTLNLGLWHKSDIPTTQ